jgi:transcription elongation factor Elf1
MGSVIDNIECPNCNHEAFSDFYYKTGEQYINCNNCGLARNYPLPYIDDISADVYQDFSYIDPYENPILWDSFFMPMINKMKNYAGSIAEN